MKEIIISNKNQGQRLDKYLSKLLPNISKSFLYKMMRKKNITLNNAKCQGMEIINEGDIIKLFFSDETYDKFSANTASKDFSNKTENDIYINAFNKIKGIKPVFENEDLLILNKPAGVICQQDMNNKISLNEWAIGYLINNGFSITDFVPSICNRIDFNTSGLVLFAKTYKGSRYAFEIISKHMIKKYYLAICQGKIDKKIDLKGYLLKDKNLNKVSISANDNGGERIETIIEPVDYKEDCSLLRIHLITGKTHQIRAHLSSIGHPLCGDIKYGGKKYMGIAHQMLHAYKLEFPSNDSVNDEDNGKLEFSCIDEASRVIIQMPDDKFLAGFNRDLI